LLDGLSLGGLSLDELSLDQVLKSKMRLMSRAVIPASAIALEAASRIKS
jgi:hypothetical protein